MRKFFLSVVLALFTVAGVVPAAHAGSICKDGSWTASEGRGTCSSHGGVSQSGVAGPSAPAPAPVAPSAPAPVVVTPAPVPSAVVTPTSAPGPAPVKTVASAVPAAPTVTVPVAQTRYCKDGTIAKSVGRGACSGHSGLAPIGAAVPAAPGTPQTSASTFTAPIGEVILPNGSTPGAINPAVTQDNIKSTICKTGYTSTIRPSSSYTTALKKQQLTGAYSYFTDKSTGAYEEDHLISLELGGAPSDPRNLWPEPYAGNAGARLKDVIENKLNSLVCSGTISLATAQNVIATNWWTAYQTYVK